METETNAVDFVTVGWPDAALGRSDFAVAFLCLFIGVHLAMKWHHEMGSIRNAKIVRADLDPLGNKTVDLSEQ